MGWMNERYFNSNNLIFLNAGAKYELEQKPKFQ